MATVASNFIPPAADGDVREDQVAATGVGRRARQTTLWFASLLTGVLLAIASPVAGIVPGMLALAAVVGGMLLRASARRAALGGLLCGFGTTSLLLVRSAGFDAYGTDGPLVGILFGAGSLAIGAVATRSFAGHGVRSERASRQAR